MILYHGSSIKTEILKPNQATGVGKDEDRQFALYATSDRDFALLFTIPVTPDGTGTFSWETITENGVSKMKINAGKVDLSGTGYLYPLDAKDFQRIDEIQFVSYKPVKPLSCEVINLSELQHLVITE
jgi:hypothetical protein